MRKFILASLMSLFTACAPMPSDTLDFNSDSKPVKQVDNSSAVFEKQYEVIYKMWERYPTTEVQVRWAPCGVLNSYYRVMEKTVVLCTEFAAYPKTAVFVAAHEMAHAIAVQHLSVRDEESADEIAAVMMLEFGLGEELLDAALFFGDGGTDNAPPSGHPSRLFRAWNLACLASGYDKHPVKCVYLYRGTKARWDERLKQYRSED